MAWPTNKPDSTAFDSDSDRISESRAELNTMSNAVNSIVDFIDTTGITNGQALVYDSASDTLKPGDVTLSQLTSNLDVNNFEITNSDTSSAGTGDITLRTAGFGGDIVLIGSTIQVGNEFGIGGTFEGRENVDMVFKTYGTPGGIIKIDSGGGGDISIQPEARGTNTQGKIFLDGKLKIQQTDGTPSNTTTPSAWLKVDIIDSNDSAGGFLSEATVYYIPLHQ